MTPATLAAAIGCGVLRANLYAEPLTLAMRSHGIESKNAVAGFLGTLAHESARLSLLTENLSYSAERLCAVWPSRFPTVAAAAPFARNPAALADKVYGGRMGNTGPGDGYRYRGRGLIQLTGRDNYAAYAQASGRSDLLSNPDGLCETATASDAAAWFFENRGALAPANAGDWARMTRAVNGGTVGMSERLIAINRALTVLAGV